MRQAVEQIAEEIDKLQALITELRPAALDALGIEPALVSLVERSRALHGMDVQRPVTRVVGRSPIHPRSIPTPTNL